jgi:AcrR family transcriptional regulator
MSDNKNVLGTKSIPSSYNAFHLGRITKQQKEQNHKKLNSVIWEILLAEGWDKITYERISESTGLSESTLQDYYSSEQDFLFALEDNFKCLLLRELNLSSKDALLSSWEKALSKTDFNFVIEMLISYSLITPPPPLASQAINSILDMIETALPSEDAGNILTHILGLSIIAPFRETITDAIS